MWMRPMSSCARVAASWRRYNALSSVRRLRMRYTALVSFAMLASLLAACSGPQDVHESRFIMGTLVQFTISGAEHAKALEAIHAASDEMQRIEDDFTIYGMKPNAVKAFNASAPGETLALPAEVGSLLQTALAVAKQSGGAFNPALGSLGMLWGFSLPDAPLSPPADADIAAARSGAGLKQLVMAQAGWNRLNPQTKLDFGAIAKGYAIDRGIAVLREHGIRNAILDAGGDLRVIGDHQGKSWRIGLRHPRKPGSTLGWFEAKGDFSIVTSGDYERFFIWQGRRYHHILNPSTGMPADASSSATVITVNATLADAWSTALFVLGEKGVPLVEALGMQALLVDADGLMHQSKLSLLPFHPSTN